MVLRWLIRGSTIALLTLCLSLWVGSYFRCVLVQSTPSFGKTYLVNTYMGGAAFCFVNHNSNNMAVWHFEYGPEVWPSSDKPTDGRQFLGFTYFYCSIISSSTMTYKGFCIPFWFPSLLSAALLWFVWRQTRLIEWRGFPVEVPPTPEGHQPTEPRA